MGLIDKILDTGYNSTSVDRQSQQAYDAFLKRYPELMDQFQQQMTPQALAELETTKATTPGYNDLALSELERTAPAVARIQGQMDAGQAANDLANLKQYGAPLGEALRTSDSAANPEYYKTLTGLGDKYQQLLAEASPTLSGGQRAEIERGTARLNPTGAENSAMSTAEKAMDFGNAHQANVQNFANIINSVSNALPALRTGLMPTDLALGRSSRSAPTNSAVTTAVKPDDKAFNVGGNAWSQMLGVATNNENLRAGKFKSWGDAIEQDSRTISNLGSAVGSFGV